MLKLHLSPSFGSGVTRAFMRLSGNTPVVRELLIVFVKYGLIMSHIDLKIFTRIVLILLDFDNAGIENVSKSTRCRLLCRDWRDVFNPIFVLL